MRCAAPREKAAKPHSYKNGVLLLSLVHLPGLEPGTTVPKTGMISVSLQVQCGECTTVYDDIQP